MINNDLKEMFMKIDIVLNDEQVSKFVKLKEELVRWNNKINLTAITDEVDILNKHFYDSIISTKFWKWKGSENVIDIGTGAGFPGLPLKILYPNLNMVLVDSTVKKINYLNHMIDILELENVSAIHARAEELGQNHMYREKYDIVVSRAVARMSVLAEYCIPLVKLGGVFIAYKGAEGSEECREALKAVGVFGGEVLKEEEYLISTVNSVRKIVIIKKLKDTPCIYPRRVGVPQKKPM
ncbi:MAG: 16S rRNA (guanine(527)-N(7))-methyltransferase RsmG [Clostridia bacterium]|nr:16S rRNA (guanine(527)-N(7))-methyltransferase RsmG [Clostridia bacterium]MDD4049020.1 16S rRNA (guanine(527)-N(7))-methyltransferase RsmG [Clostridia bacterium]